MGSLLVFWMLAFGDTTPRCLVEKTSLHHGQVGTFLEATMSEVLGRLHMRAPEELGEIEQEAASLLHAAILAESLDHSALSTWGTCRR